MTRAFFRRHGTRLPNVSESTCKVYRRTVTDIHRMYVFMVHTCDVLVNIAFGNKWELQSAKIDWILSEILPYRNALTTEECSSLTNWQVIFTVISNWTKCSRNDVALRTMKSTNIFSRIFRIREYLSSKPRSRVFIDVSIAHLISDERSAQDALKNNSSDAKRGAILG